MKAIALHLSLLSLALGCASPSATAQEEADPNRSGFEPIRFGDPEEGGYDAPFFPGARYDERIPAPEFVLGQEHATRFSHHEEIVACFRRWSEASPRLVLQPHGKTHEGRALVHAVVTSPANHERLERILAAHAELQDPRGRTDGELDALLSDLPAIAWMGYSIHGDELSGADASVALGYHLAACVDPEVTELLDDVVIVIDPVMIAVIFVADIKRRIGKDDINKGLTFTSALAPGNFFTQ